MFTTIDKNLLIAALESAIYHACVNANVMSLHAIETGVSALRQRFDANPDDVLDAEIYTMLDTIGRAAIPSISHLSSIENVSNIAYRVVSFLWENIVDKPDTYPPSEHTHAALETVADWSDITNKPATFPADPHAHDYASITSKPLMFPPTAHEHDYSSLLNKPATFPPDAHDHPSPSAIASPFQFGDLIFRRGEIEGVLDYSMDGGQSWDWRFPPVQHMHADYGDIDYPVRDEIMKEVTARQKAGNIYLIPSSLVSVYASYQHFTAVCNGSTILRATPAGDLLVSGGCQFGNGDGSTTVNLPDMTALAPAGFAYVMFIGSW